jgi:hypothetical protein
MLQRALERRNGAACALRGVLHQRRAAAELQFVRVAVVRVPATQALLFGSGQLKPQGGHHALGDDVFDAEQLV